MQVAALGLHHLVLGVKDAAHLDLDALGHLLPDENIPVRPDAAHNGLVQLAACQLDGLFAHNAVERQHCNIGSAATHIQDKASPGDREIQPSAQGSCHRLLDEVDLPGTGRDCCVHTGTALHTGDAGRHTDAHTGLGEGTFACLFEEVPEHLLGLVKVRDDAVLEGVERPDAVGGAADHLEGLLPHLEHLTAGGIHCHH